VSESVVSGVVGRRHVIEENIIRAVYEFCHSVTSRVGYVGSAVRVATVEIALHDCWESTFWSSFMRNCLLGEM